MYVCAFIDDVLYPTYCNPRMRTRTPIELASIVRDAISLQIIIHPTLSAFCHLSTSIEPRNSPKNPLVPRSARVRIYSNGCT